MVWTVTPRCIIVLGAERSGTSLCAEMVSAWGAYPGPSEQLPTPDCLNPHGRWEHLPLLDIHAAIGGLTAGHTVWDEDFETTVAQRAINDARLEQWARSLVSAMARPGRPWVWKEPTFCHFLGFWRPFWNDPIFIMMVRHPVDSALSWQHFVHTAWGRTPTSMACNLLRWQHMTLSALRGTQVATDVRFVEYERLVADPVGQAQLLRSFLDRTCGSTPDERAVDRMVRACDPALRRHASGADHLSQLSSAQRSLYALQLKKVGDPALPIEDTFPFPPQWRQRVINEEQASRRSGI
jgi:O-antigen biosynthesis protein